MLKLTIPEMEIWDSINEEFNTIPSHTLQFEHSLLSISKWEAKHCKPFLSENLSGEDALDYYRCMLITQNVDQSVFKYLPQNAIKQLNDYIQHPMTATTFTEYGQSGKSKGRTIITSELIYYWMIIHNIPFECEKWHLNRLLTLIRVCNAKNGADKKMSRSEILANNRALNAARRAKLHSRG